MGRDVTLDFSAGGGSDTEFLIGTITLEPTAVHEIGNRVVLPAPRATGINAGIGTLEDVAISPAGPEPEWAYRATVRDSISGKVQSWLVGVPTGTTAIPFKQLTKFTTTIPPQTTAGMMQNWADTTAANADRSELAADRAEAPTDLMNKNLIENPASLTSGALSEIIDESISLGGTARSTLDDAMAIANRGARRSAMQDALAYGGGQWWISRRTSGDYQFVRDIGGGEFWGWRLIRDFGSAGNYNTAYRLQQCGAGIPMVPAPMSGPDTAITGSWFYNSNLQDGVTPPPDLGMGVIYVTGSTVAGSTAFTVDGAVPESHLTTGRTYIIPGAGIGGADLVTSSGGNTPTAMVFAHPAQVTLSSVVLTVQPALRTSGAVSGDSATWTTPANTTSVGVSLSLISGGLYKVSVNGSSTAANMLPTAQQVVNSGAFPSSILTTNGGTLAPNTRVIDGYHQAQVWVFYQGIASGLVPGIHTVKLEVTGYKQVASNGFRIFLQGWAYGTATTTPATPKALIFPHANIGSVRGAHEFAYSHKPTGATIAEFAGVVHGWENQIGGLVVTVDGIKTKLVDGQVLAGNVITVERTSDLYHPQKTDTPSATVMMTYRADVNGLTVEHVDVWKTSTYVDAGYPVMFSWDSRTLDRGQVDTSASALIINNGTNTYDGLADNTGIIAWQSTGDIVSGVFLPNAETITGGWSMPLVKASIRDREPDGGERLAKVYVGRQEQVSAGDVWISKATYVVARIPHAAALLPVA